jgi:hypothetical protein
MKQKKLPQKFQKDLYQSNKSKLHLSNDMSHFYKTQQKRTEFLDKQEAYKIKFSESLQKYAEKLNNSIEDISPEKIENLMRETNPYIGKFVQPTFQLSEKDKKKAEFGFVQRDLVDEIILSNYEHIESRCDENNLLKLSGLEEIFLN